MYGTGGCKSNGRFRACLGRMRPFSGYPVLYDRRRDSVPLEAVYGPGNRPSLPRYLPANLVADAGLAVLRDKKGGERYSSPPFFIGNYTLPYNVKSSCGA